MNVKDRYSDYQSYQDWLGLPQKPFWAVPQAFESQSFWKREATPAELIAMTLLSIGAGAKGVVMWVWPTSAGLAAMTEKFSKEVVSAARPFWLGSKVHRGLATQDGRPSTTLDVSAWLLGNQLLVTVTNAGSRDIDGEIEWVLPNGIQGKAVRNTLWGEAGWTVNGRNQLVKAGFAAVDNAVLILDVVT